MKIHSECFKALGKKALKSATKSVMMGTVARRIYLALTITVNDNEHNKQGQSGPAVPMAPRIWTNNIWCLWLMLQCCAHNPAASCIWTLQQDQLQTPNVELFEDHYMGWAWWDKGPQQLISSSPALSGLGKGIKAEQT